MTHHSEVEGLVAEKFTTNKNEGIGPAIPDRKLPRMILSKRAYNTVIELLTTHSAKVRETYLKQIRCQQDIDGDVCDCCRANYERINDIV